MLARAITEHSSLALVAAHLGISKNTVARWCDPDDPFDVTLRDVSQMPAAVAQSIAQQMAAADDAVATERLAHARTRELYAETFEEALELSCGSIATRCRPQKRRASPTILPTRKCIQRIGVSGYSDF